MSIQNLLVKKWTSYVIDRTEHEKLLRLSGSKINKSKQQEDEYVMYIVVSFITLFFFYLAGCFCGAETIDILKHLILPVSLINWVIILKSIMKKRKTGLDKKQRVKMIAIPCSVFPTYLLCTHTLRQYLFYKGEGIEHLPHAAAEAFSVGAGLALGILVCSILWINGFNRFVINRVIDFEIK